MKQGRDIVGLAQELQRRAEAKIDYVAPTKKLRMVNQQLVVSEDAPALDITNHAHRQIGTWAKVPAKYYDRMQAEAPQLLEQNINHWFSDSKASRMVRTLDGNARAFLSDRYRRIDNEDVAETVLPILLEPQEVRIASCEVTDRRLYLKAVFPKVEGEIQKGDVVQAGVIIQNSEIGLGSLSIQPFILRLVCLNGMISNDHSLSRYHVGRKIEGDGDQAYQLFQDTTLQADDKALMMKIRDIVRAASQEATFNQIVEKMREATKGPQIANPVAAVEVLAKNHTLNEREQQSVLENLIKGGDYSRYGVLNAVTATANNHESYDRATEFEGLGGKILDLTKNEWGQYVEAAA